MAAAERQFHSRLSNLAVERKTAIVGEMNKKKHTMYVTTGATAGGCSAEIIICARRTPAE
jgi:hypothetical protein